MNVILITGCSSGIGLETALAFARRGDTVCASMRTLAKSDRLMSRAAAEDLTIHLVQLDVTDPDSVRQAVAAVVAQHGAIDVLVNNAGVAYSAPVETFDMDRAKAAMDTNFWGAFRTIQAVVPSMRERHTGVIVNILSVVARLPGSGYTGMYAASKHALGRLSESLWYEVERFGVRVVCIEPGIYATDIVANATEPAAPVGPYSADHEWVEEFFRKSVETAGDPSVVAAAIVDAANDPSTPIHVVVGDDAAMLVELAKQADSVESFSAVMTDVVESQAGPRPVLR